jgi:ketosteroid isomerase-like protein
VSRQDLELVRSMLETLNESGVEAALDQIHPDFEGVTPPELSPEPDTYRGHEGIRRYFAGFEGVMDEVRWEADELTEAPDDRVVAGIRLLTRSVATGLELELPVWQLCTVRDGKVLRIEGFAKREDALRAAGIEP